MGPAGKLLAPLSDTEEPPVIHESFALFNGRFPEITGEDNLTVFSYSDTLRSSGMDLLQFILDYHLGEPTIRSARSPQAMSV